MDWVGLNGFKSQTSQNPSYFFSISSNPYATGITEQALNWITYVQWQIYGHYVGDLMPIVNLILCFEMEVDGGSWRQHSLYFSFEHLTCITLN
jgi:hypothetical protein